VIKDPSAVRRWTPRPNAAFRVICFPFAGGSASAFLPCSKRWDDAIEVCAVEYPGRATRAREPLCTTAEALVADLAPPLAAYLDKPFVVLGYSVGAVVAFEWVRKLEAANARQPVGLFVCARRAPQDPERQPPLTGLDDRAFVAAVQARYGGIPDAILNEPELVAMMLPSLRADLQISEAYHLRENAALACPIHAFGGELDPVAQRESLAGWAAQTRGAFELDVFRANHFFLDSHQAELGAAVMRRLRARDS
jgi:medium-chain acyl-[acyl-carrier-protein] hydrolase